MRTGRFTTPHHLHRSDSIHLHNAPCPPLLFTTAESCILARAAKLNITPTPFELLTATAFEIFTTQNIDIAVIEVGMGGRLDATNILPSPDVCVISKIDLDHTGFLGDTLEKVAYEKAGILKPGARVVCDASNTDTVKEVVTQRAKEVGVKGEVQFVGPTGTRPTRVQSRWGGLEVKKHLPGAYQAGNVAVAVAAAEELADLYPITAADVVRALAETCWPGRLETVDASALGAGEVLVDGAHNAAAAEALRGYVDEVYPGAVTWVLAFSQGKDVGEMVRGLVREGDGVVVTGFGEVDGMPWVRCVPPGEIAGVCEGAVVVGEVGEAVKVAAGLGRPVVVAGSLYLGSELARRLEGLKSQE